MANSGRGALEQIGQGFERSSAVDSSGRIVGCVDDHQPRLGSDCSFDSSEIEIKRGRLQIDLSRHGIRGQQHRLIAEPRWFRVDHLVTGIDHEPKGDHYGSERAGCQRYVSRLKGKIQLEAQPLGDKGLRVLLARLIGEPILVVRDCPLSNRGDDTFKWHFVRIAEGEVTYARHQASAQRSVS